ncbi:HEAT repeat domain-containing protein [Paenibacillus gallinarum]|uniref:HEAT repeat domain-containing protein n=1 Tax=Paenibacillus gallinarum TaxID=2762232 RepID=A0ABR8SWI1_9BACL|nr:HEAT repeat domain-containing protein [Paenibacillus gallinarum]MBD7967870.1 HEAT repeat domain-containing protein [Paenibacillus gallinarum]
MFSNLALAYIFLYLCAGLIAVGIGLLITMKTTHNSKERKKEEYANKHKDYFVYVQANLTGNEKLQLPPGKLTKIEEEVIMDRLIVIHDQIKGEHAAKLRDIARESGLIAKQMKQLDSISGSKTIEAAYRLGGIRGSEATTALLQVLKEEKKVAHAVIYARAVAKCAERPAELKEMLRYLLDKGKPVYELAADILMETSLTPSNLLQELLESDHYNDVKVGLVASYAYASPEVMPAVIRLFRSKDETIRTDAIKLYLSRGPVLKDQTMKELMRDSNPEVRTAMANALGSIHTEDSIQLLQKGLSDVDMLVRNQSAESLAGLGVRGFEVLCETAATASGMAREAALAYTERAMATADGQEEVEKMMTLNKKKLIYQRYFGASPKEKQTRRMSEVIGGDFTA